MATIQIGNRYFPTSAIEILTRANTAPTDERTIDLSAFGVPSDTRWAWIGCPLARAPIAPRRNQNGQLDGSGLGTVDMSWTCRLFAHPEEDFDKWLQIALQCQPIHSLNEIINGVNNNWPHGYQEASGKTVCIPMRKSDGTSERRFIWRTRCPDNHDYYDGAELTLTLLGWEVP